MCDIIFFCNICEDLIGIMYPIWAINQVNNFSINLLSRYL